MPIAVVKLDFTLSSRSLLFYLRNLAIEFAKFSETGSSNSARDSIIHLWPQKPVIDGLEFDVMSHSSCCFNRSTGRMEGLSTAVDLSIPTITD